LNSRLLFGLQGDQFELHVALRLAIPEAQLADPTLAGVKVYFLAFFLLLFFSTYLLALYAN
jgi:hypothetical protein